MSAPLLALLLAQLQPLPPQLIALDSDEGRKLLVESQHNKDFFALSSHFLTQRSTAFCGVASSVMALNALDLKAPEAKELGWRYFTEDNVFAASQKSVTGEQVAKGGMIVDQVRALLEANGGEVTATLASTSSLEAFRKSVSENLARSGDYVLVDFLRAELGQDTGAHWSPLAAYHAGSDRFLVLDVARFRYPPYWAKAEDLFKAMNTTDPDSQLSRGWVEVKKQPDAPAREPAPPVKGKLGRMIAMAGGGTFLLGALVGALITRWRMKKKAALNSAAA
jgi:hypothetical protein